MILSFLSLSLSLSLFSLSLSLLVCVCVYIYIYFGLVGIVFTNGLGDRGSIPGRVILKTWKVVFDTFLFNTRHCKGKVELKRQRSCGLL